MADDFDPAKYLSEKTAQTGRISQPVMNSAPAADFDPAKYLAEKTGAPQTATDLKGQALLDYMRSGGDQSERNRAPLGQVVGAAKNLADYPGGLVRTGLAEAGGLVTGKPGLVNEGDVKNALLGNAPKSSEYMERAGVPAGPSVTLPYFGNTSARDVVGFGADVATDPLTYAAGKGLVNPVGEAAEAAGKSTYKSGFKKIDERLAEKGKKPLSDLLLENGAPTGTTKSVAGDVKSLGEKLMNDRQAIYEKATDKGATVDLGFPLPNAEAELAKLRGSPTKSSKKLADDLEDLMNDYKSQGKVDLSKVSDWKSEIYDNLPDSAFSGPKVKKAANRFQKALASDLKSSIEQGAESAEPGLGDKVKNINQDLGSIITSEKPTAMQVRRGNTPNTVTSIDAILSHEPGLLALKKGADIAKTTYARTKAGKGLMLAGRSGGAQGLINRGLLNKRKQQGLIDEGSPGEQLMQSGAEP